jgi:hypothetical protein
MKLCRSLTILLALITLAGCETRTFDFDSAQVPFLPRPDPPKFCALCGAPTISIGTIEDDRSRPSRNIAVWNRSMCGNLFYGTGSAICSRCWQAYSTPLRRWQLGLDDPSGFYLPLSEEMTQFPLPKSDGAEVHPVYYQEYDGEVLTEKVAFWCKSDDKYLAAAQAHAAKHSLELKVYRAGRLPDEMHLTIGRHHLLTPTTRPNPS